MVSSTTRTISADRLFRALSDPTRLRILNLLRSAADFNDGRGCCTTGDGEVCVCDLTRVIAAPQPTISRHLAYLRRAGLVLQRKHGLWKYYRLAKSSSRVHTKLLECLDACRADLPKLAADYRRLRRECGDDCCKDC